MPGQDYEGVAEFVLEVITSRGVNARPPLLVSVGMSTSAETAARLPKKAILRPVTSRHPNEMIEVNKAVFNQKKKPILERINQQVRFIR